MVNIVKFQLVINENQNFIFNFLILIKGQSNACASFPCYNNGSCTPAGASFLCTCKEPYSGTQCQIANPGIILIRYEFALKNYLVAPCFSSPCKNGGT